MELTNEQISKLTPEQVTEFENDEEALAKYLADQETGETETETDEPEQADEEDGAANGAGKEQDEEEAEPVVLTKNGKGTIPYEKHKALRVENATLKEQLQTLQKAQAELELLRQKQAQAKTPGNLKELQEKLKKHIARTREDFPDVGDSLEAVDQLVATLQTEIETDKAERQKQAEEAKAKAEKEAEEKQRHIDEQVQEAKENNPDLVYWEKQDGDEWREAMFQDAILIQSPKWANRPMEERFVEVVKRVRAVMPDASEPPNAAPSAKTREKAKAAIEKAPERKPTTLSDIQGGGQPMSEKERAENLAPHQLVAKLMKMPHQQAAAMRADLD